MLAANADEIGQPRPSRAEAQAYAGTRLLLDAGTAHGASAATGTLRRIHVSPLELPSLWRGQVPGPLREIALFEHVAGARLVGQAPPGTQVTATLDVKHPGAPAFAFVQVGRAGTDGRFALRVPYATQDMPFGLAARSLWRIQAGGVTQEVAVPERAVQTGADIVLP